MRIFQRIMRRRATERGTAIPRPWVYADYVESAVTYAECERLADLAINATVLEIGSYLGRSTIAMASTARVVHAVDPHMGGWPEHSPSTLESFLANLEASGIRDKVVVHVAKSNDIADVLMPELFDLVFVDAMHQRPDVDFDTALAARCVRNGGAIAFHDYGVDGVMVGELWHPFGVTEAVDEFVGFAALDSPAVVDSLAVVQVPPVADAERRSAWLAAVSQLPLSGHTEPAFKR